jgi:hypothetical protein
MARMDASQLLNALGPSLRAAANHVLYHAYGPDGRPWGTRFPDAEDLAVQVGDLLTREVLQAALQGQAARSRPEERTLCPSCGGPLEARPAQARTVSSRRGTLAWDKPACFCTCCRRALIPSDQEPQP